MSKYTTDIGKAIRTIRMNHDLSQEALSELADLHRTYIGALERGEKNPTMHTVEKLARALGVSPSYIIDLSLPSQDRESCENDD